MMKVSHLTINQSAQSSLLIAIHTAIVHCNSLDHEVIFGVKLVKITHCLASKNKTPSLHLQSHV